MSSMISTYCFLPSLYNVSISFHPYAFGKKSHASVIKRNSNVTIIKNENRLESPIYLHNNISLSVSVNTANEKTITTKPTFPKLSSIHDQQTSSTITDDTIYVPFSTRSINQPVKESIKESINQHVNQPVNQFVNQHVKVESTTKQLIDVPSTNVPPTNRPTINTKEDLSEKPIHYFPWNDGIDYANACKNLLNALSNNTGPIIVSNGYHGGIGHKFLSLFYHVTYALLLHRNLYLQHPSFLYDSTQTCLHKLQFLGNSSNLQRCPNLMPPPCFKSRDNVYSMYKKDYLLVDTRINLNSITTSKNLQVINNLHLVNFTLTWKSYQRLIIRLFLNPSDEIQEQVFQQLKPLQPLRNTIGMHLRCAGSLADSRESIYWVAPDELPRVAHIIKRVTRYLKLKNPIFYLSTDSSIAEQFLRNELKSYKFFTLNKKYKRGRCQMKCSDDVRVAVFVDLFTVAQLNSQFYMSSSGYSFVISSLANANYTYTLGFRKRKLKKYCVC